MVPLSVNVVTSLPAFWLRMSSVWPEGTPGTSGEGRSAPLSVMPPPVVKVPPPALRESSKVPPWRTIPDAVEPDSLPVVTKNLPGSASKAPLLTMEPALVNSVPLACNVAPAFTVSVPSFTVVTAFQSRSVPGPVAVRLAPLSMVRLPT